MGAIAPQQNFVNAVRVFPGGRQELKRYVHVADVMDVDKAINLLKQGSSVYVLTIALPELLSRWQPEQAQP